jgi:hypothetical protein
MIDIDTRLKALARLARSQTDDAKVALQRELDQVGKNLRSEQDYELIMQGLAVLDAIGSRFSAQAVSILEYFVEVIENRDLQYSEQEPGFVEIARYKNAHTLLVRAIEVLAGLRYLETPSVFRILLQLVNHTSDRVRKKASGALDALAGYNIDAFYGPDRKGGIGATPQKVVIDALQHLRDPELVANSQAALNLLRALLSPTMEASSWSYDTAKFFRGVTPASPEISEIRLRSIQLLKRLYRLASTISQRVAIIAVLHDATRMHDVNTVDQKVSGMIVRDAEEVLAFYEQLIKTEDLRIVQKIESHSYWIYRHAHRDEIREKALSVESAIARNMEYQIYRVLIGFEGVFGDWSELVKSKRDFRATDEMRKRAASQYAAGINANNYVEWRLRILDYAKTESSDLATFPIFYHFLEDFAKAHPTLALKLLKDDADAIERFLIPLMRGLWAGSQRRATQALIEKWINQASPHEGRCLFASAKLFLSNEHLDLELLERILAKAAEINDLATVRQIISVAITNYRPDRASILNELFLPALAVLTREGDATWIFDAWFRREIHEVVAALNDKSRHLILQNLISLPEIDYHAEEVLYTIAQRAPEAVISFFCDRIEFEATVPREGVKEFEAIPFEFHKLQEPLAKSPQLAVRLIREHFEKNSALFEFRGARFLHNVFPGFAPEFEAELLELVKGGGEANYLFVLGVLRSYQGQHFIHRVCREIVRGIPIDSALRTEVAIALEATGMVAGVFGFAEAYERKRREMLDWLTEPDERVQSFAKSCISDLERMRDAEQKRAEEEIALRKFRYGED